MRGNVFWLSVIFLIGILVRIVGSGYFPPALNWDEVSHGYNAYSLLKTGRDEWGTKLPSIFKAFGDYKLPVYIYLTVPVYSNPRIPSAIFGSLSIVLAGILAYDLSKKSRMLLIVSWLFCLEPWSWFFSRIAIEANVSLTFILMGAVLFFRKKSLLGLLIFWGLSMWTYNSARIFVPLALLLGLFRFSKKVSLKILVAVTVILLPVVWQFIDSSGLARFKWTSLIDQGAVNRIGEMRSNSDLSGVMKRIVYNKATYFAYQSGMSLASYLSPKYWLSSGGNQYQYTVQGQGLVYLFDIVWFMAGVFYLSKNRKNIGLLTFWFLLALIPGSITRDAPHPLRTVYAIFPIFFAIGTGVNFIIEKWGKRQAIIFIVGQIVFFTNYLFVTSNYRTNYSWSWQYGYDQVSEYVRNNEKKYDKIIITKKYGEPHEFLAYFLKIDPVVLQTKRIWNFHDDWYWTDGFGKYSFVNDWEMKKVGVHIPNQKILVISSPENPISGGVVKKINFLNGQPAFILVEI